MAAIKLDPFTRLVSINFGQPYWVGSYIFNGTPNFSIPPSGTATMFVNARGGVRGLPGGNLNVLPFQRQWPVIVTKAEMLSAGTIETGDPGFSSSGQGIRMFPLPGGPDAFPFGIDISVSIHPNSLVDNFSVRVFLINANSKPPIVGQSVGLTPHGIGNPFAASNFVHQDFATSFGDGDQTRTFHADVKRFTLTAA